MEQTFNERCYSLLKTVPPGKVTTYGELAKALGSKGARAVGNAMNRNPYAPTVPCHRVVRSDGGLGGYQGGLPKKIKLLKGEGVQVEDGRIVNFQDRIYRFDP